MAKYPYKGYNLERFTFLYVRYLVYYNQGEIICSDLVATTAIFSEKDTVQRKQLKSTRTLPLYSKEWIQENEQVGGLANAYIVAISQTSS